MAGQLERAYVVRCNGMINTLFNEDYHIIKDSNALIFVTKEAYEYAQGRAIMEGFTNKIFLLEPGKRYALTKSGIDSWRSPSFFVIGIHPKWLYWDAGYYGYVSLDTPLACKVISG